MIKPPKEISFARYKALCRNSKYSLLRYMQYEILDGIEVPGRVLDIGGTHDPNKPYKQLLRGHTEWLCLNFPHGRDFPQPDIQADCNERLPFDDNSFDHAFSFNTMEHIYSMEFAVEEMFRIVKPGGKLLVHIPFLYSVHGAPDDFNRPTSSWWQTKFVNMGVPDEKIKITPLVWCTLSSGVSLMDNKWSEKRRKWLRPLYLFPALFGKKICKKEIPQLTKDTPLGYFVEVFK